MLKNNWIYRKGILGPSYDFLQNTAWNSAHYIIRLGFNGACSVYDTRLYADMNKLDFNYFGYSLLKQYKSVKTAKQYINYKLRNEEN